MKIPKVRSNWYSVKTLIIDEAFDEFKNVEILNELAQKYDIPKNHLEDTSILVCDFYQYANETQMMKKVECFVFNQKSGMKYFLWKIT